MSDAGATERALHGARTTLVRRRRGHAEALAEIVNDVDVARYLLPTFPSPYAFEDALAWIAADRGASPPLQFAIEAAGDLVESIGLRLNCGERRGSVEIGSFVGMRFWGRGFATDAIRSITAYAFTLPGVVRVWANPMAPNVASARALARAGYKHVATVPLGIVDRTGARHDELIYAKSLASPSGTTTR